MAHYSRRWQVIHKNLDTCVHVLARHKDPFKVPQQILDCVSEALRRTEKNI